MRNLTIRREKSLAASSELMQFYLEDHVLGTTFINGLPCRLLGELRNGEKATFFIETDAAKLFALPEKKRTDQCGEYLSLPEGDGALFVRGQNYFNPLAGHPFQFQGVSEKAVLDFRKKGRNKGIAGLAAVLAVIVILGLIGVYLLTGGGASKKDFSADGISITLTEDFERVFVDGFALSCKSHDVAMFVLKEPFTLMEGAENLQVQEYANIVFQYNIQAANAQLLTDGNTTWFEYSYTNTMENKDYHFFIYVFKSDDAFWLVQFATPEALAQEYKPQFLDWAKTVDFS